MQYIFCKNTSYLFKGIPQQQEVKYDIRFWIINNILYYIVLGFFIRRMKRIKFKRAFHYLF